jgi:transposase
MARVVFKPDKKNQLMLLPPDLGSLIPDNHIVRLVDKIVDDIALSPLFDTYKGGGTSSYSPRMLLKVITYAYIEKIYTNRPMAKALKENIYFMWLSGMSTPDFTTINNFRSKRLKESIDDVFSSVIEVLVRGGYVKAENLFVDGTKIEANANKYSYIWKKNVERYEAIVRDKVKKLLAHIEELQKAEDAEYGSHDLAEYEGKITADQIDKVVSDINKKITKSSKSKISKLKKEAEQLKKYQVQKDILGDRNSCSKTDNDATFFRMKEDQAGGLLKPAYNVQIATEDQYILGYGIYQKAADTSVFIPFMDRIKNELGIPRGNVIADAGYGSEENYDYVERNGIGNYIKYNNINYEKSHKHKEKRFLADHFIYDNKKNQYECPAGQKLDFTIIKNVITTNGYKTEKFVYRAQNCQGCIYKEECCKGQHNRSIERSPRLIDYKNTVRENLKTETGKILAAKRKIDVESVFGQIKHNNHFRRFNTRGLKNVNTEWGIISIAHNIKKMAN